MLYSYYTNLTNKTDYSRFGSHWEVIGFQQRDPVMDFRGVGIFGLLQSISLLNYHKDLLKNFFQYSLEEKHKFPLSLVYFS